MIAIYILLILMIIGALVAIEVKDLLSSVIAVGAVGLGFSFIALILKAPDVAITQLVVEIIAVIILIRATVREGLPGSVAGWRVGAAVVAVVFVLVLLLTATSGFTALREFGTGPTHVSRYYLGHALDTGATNVVAAILLDFRAYDTLGEATVLFTAVIGVMAVVRRVGRKTESTVGDSDDD